jgi:hypothetical protein
MSFAVRFLALATGVVLSISVAEAQVGEIKAQAPPLTLEQLVKASEKIVQGKVEEQSVVVKSLSNGKQEIPTQVYQIRLRVEEVLKGSVKPGDTITVSEWANIAQPVKEGDELLLYLPAESRFGLASPVGIYSGQFKITPAKDGTDVKEAINLNNNVGLWSEKESLYASSPKVNYNSLDLSVKDPQVRAQIMEQASKPNQPGPLSVDLITGATKALTKM